MAHFGKSLEQGLGLLEQVAEAGVVPYGVLREQSGMPNSSFARYLGLLQDRGYLMQTDEGYMLGWRLAQLGATAQAQDPLPAMALPHLHALVGDTEETAELVRYAGEEFVFLQRVESPRAVVLKARPGSRFPVTGTNAIGRIGLAFGYGSGVKALDDKTLRRIRSDEYDAMLQNNDEVLRAAAALIDPSGHIVGCMVIAAPAFRVTPSLEKTFRDLLLTHAQALSTELGYRGFAEEGA